jgi:Tol biopolymer transport system component
MGEVYRARDLQLDRTVAVKVLPHHIAANAEARARFEREARAISALNHPHICTLHDVGREGDVAFFVMELVDGETLGDRMAKGRMPVENAIAIAAQIASALEAAHRRGIVHRDLKPANVMLTKSGVKLLDFGVARLTALESARDDTTAPPTLLTPVTSEGMILGTLQYMAPEQLEAKPVDARADLFSLGCIIYEMVAGRRAFDGTSHASVISAIMTTEPPPLAQLAPIAPSKLERLVRKCLAKSPGDRWQNAADLETELGWIAADFGGSTEAITSAPRRSWRWVWPAIALLAIAALAGSLWRARRATADAPLMRVAAATFGAGDAGLLTHHLALSPDGKHLAWAGPDKDQTALWIRSFNSTEARALPDSSGVTSPMWAPDSRSIAAFRGGKLLRFDLDGGEPETICEVSPGAIIHGTWGADGTIVFAEITGRPGLFRVPAAGGVPVVIAGTESRMPRPAWPQFIGDSKRVLYCAVGGDQHLLYTLTLDSGEPPKAHGTIPSRVEVVGDTIVFAHDGTLFAQRFDPKTIERIGEPVQIASHIACYESLGSAAFSARSGAVAYLPFNAGAKMTSFDRAGTATEVAGTENARAIPRLSRDGRKVAFGRSDPKTGTSDIWIADLTRGGLVQLHQTRASEALAVWSPDGTALAFGSDTGGPPHLFIQRIGESVQTEVTAIRGIQYLSDWSADGRTLVFDESNPTTRRDILLVAPQPHSQPRVWLQTPFAEQRGRLSTDGRWMAFTSNASGRNEIYVAPFDRPGESVQVSSGGGSISAWRADGSELFYATTDGRVYSVALRTTPRFDAAPPHLLFQNTVGTADGFDAAPDGSRFLFVSSPDEAKNRPIQLVTGWRSLLTAKGKSE